MSALAEELTETFSVPHECEAREPAELRGIARDHVRMLVSDRTTGALAHDRFDRLASWLRRGDVLIANDSATLPAALGATRRNGEALLIHVADEVSRQEWIVEPRGASHPGERFTLPAGASARLIAPLDVARPRLWRAEVSTPLAHADYLRANGSPIRYAHTSHDIPIESYQSIFARSHASGSAEMPSAGRPFTPRTFDGLRARGIEVATITLHAGVSSPEAHELPQAERFVVPDATAALVNDARSHGRRIVAIGTTVVRALESAVADGRVIAAYGRTRHLVTTSSPPRVVDGLLTGFHEPRASHLLMLQAFLCRRRLHDAYAAALGEGYLWHEFGDVHLIV